MTQQSLSAQLRDAFEGSETDSFGASDSTVHVQLADTLVSLTELERFPIALLGGSQTNLSTVAGLTASASYPSATRKNGMAVARIQGEIDRGATTSTAISNVVLDDLTPALEEQFPSVAIRIGGATEEQQQSQSSIMMALLLGLVRVYMVLAFQFRSYTLPIVVMLSIPVALIGTILGHWGLGLDFSMPSMIGFASLADIVVNNAVLFLTFLQTQLVGDDYVSASLNAVPDRFRAILLSTSSNFIGQIPIILDGSLQVQTLISIVLSVAFGLVAAMVLVVLVLPSVLSIHFDKVSVRKSIGRFENRGSPVPEGGNALRQATT